MEEKQKRIKIEQRIDMMEKFINKYPVIWIKKSSFDYDKWNKLVDLEAKIKSNEIEVSDEEKNLYQSLLKEFCLEIGLAKIVDFERLKSIIDELEICKDSFLYITHRNSMGLLPEKLKNKMRDINAGGIFGSDMDDLRKKSGITRTILAEIILKYGSIENFRQLYIEYMINLFSGKKCTKLDLCGAEKYLVQGFDISNPDFIFRRKGIGLFCEDVLEKQNWFIESDKLKKQIDEYMLQLKERTKDIIYDYYGIGMTKKKSLKAIEEKYGISDSRILQLKDSVLKKLQRNTFEIEETIKNSKLDSDEMGIFIKEFFEKHDIFYRIDTFDLDDDSRESLNTMYREFLNLKNRRINYANKEAKAQRHVQVQLENAQKREKMREETKKKIMEEMLEKITIYDIGVDADIIGKFPDITIAVWFTNPFKNIDLGIKAEIDNRIKLLKMKLEMEIDKGLKAEKVDYVREDIKTLSLSVRAYHALRSIGITTIGQVVKLTQEQLLNIKNLGEKTYKEINSAIHSLDLHFANESVEFEAEHYRFICDIEDILDRVIEKEKSSRPIEDLGLSLRTYNVLKRYRINSIEKLATISPSELVKFYSLGQKGYKEIVEKMHAMGYRFMCEEDKTPKMVSEEYSDETLDQDLEFVIQNLTAAYNILRNREEELRELIQKIKHQIDYKTVELGMENATEQIKKYEEYKQEYEKTIHKRKLIKRDLKKMEKER